MIKALWSFVTGRLGVEEFEAFVYRNMLALETVFVGDAVEDLVALNYETQRPGALRRDIKDAIERIPVRCECLKIPPAYEMGTDFLAHIEDSLGLIHYVDRQVSRTFTPIWRSHEVSGVWQRKSSTTVDQEVFLRAGRVSTCKECGAHWLVIFDEATVAYLFLELTSADVQARSGSLLQQRLADGLGYRRVGVR